MIMTHDPLLSSPRYPDLLSLFFCFIAIAFLSFFVATHYCNVVCSLLGRLVYLSPLYYLVSSRS